MVNYTKSSADHSGTQGAVTNQARTQTDDNNGTSGTETRSQTNAKLTKKNYGRPKLSIKILWKAKKNKLPGIQEA